MSRHHKIALAALATAASVGCTQRTAPRFEVSFPASLSAKPITGHVFVAAWTRSDVEPRIAAMESSLRFVGRVPFFARDVDQMAPGEPVIVDSTSSSFPADLKDLPAGDYYVQAVLNVYTQYHRADGHTLWARQGDWDGQHWAYSPGNLVSTPIKVHLDPAQGFDVHLVLDHALPAIEPPPDTKWVKRFKIQSTILTKWWGGVPQYFGATILLPKGYDEHPTTYYPVLYLQNHFTLAPPYNFTEDSAGPIPGANVQMNIELVPPIARSHVEGGHPFTGGGLRESGFEFHKSWLSDRFPRMIIVTFQHPPSSSTTRTR